MAIEPDIWFLDEPFSALDPLIRREMQDEFLRLQDMLGKTIIFVTHDFDEALRLADRIAIMKDGAIEQCDTPDKIVLNPATDYVAKFTQEIDTARVVRAKTLMRAGSKKISYWVLHYPQMQLFKNWHEQLLMMLVKSFLLKMKKEKLLDQ